MSQQAFIPSRNLLRLCTFLVAFALPVAAAAKVRVSESYGKLPLHFEVNRGQTHEDVRFLSRGAGYSLYLTAGEAVLVLAKPNPDRKRDARSTPEQPDAPAQAKPVALRMSLVGATRKPLVSGLEELPGKANYFIGKDPAKWRTNIPTYAKVHYREVYPGIDLVYYGNQRQLEYDFVVAPGADLKKIVLGFKGANRLEIDAQGDLVLHAAGGAIRQHRPVIYQEIDGVRTEIEGSYVLKGANRIGFKVTAYDASRPLVIDPVLSYSTYLGGSALDAALGIAVDPSGNAYVTGQTVSQNFPTMAGVFQPIFGGVVDAFVTKLDSSGSELVYSTYLGGSGRDAGFGIAIDAFGNAYVSGSTESTNFPTTSGAFQPAHAGGPPDPQTGIPPPEAFVTKLNPAGSALVYSTYLGGSGNDAGFGIAVDPHGNAYVTGRTGSSNYPIANAVQSTFGSGVFDAFVTKLDSSGSGLVYSTYLGGSGVDEGFGIAVDPPGNAYVTGGTRSSNYPIANAVQSTFGGGVVDTFVTKLDSSGSELVYSTYLGGSGVEGGFGIAVDPSGSAYVTGQTESQNFPTTAGVFQPIFGGVVDAFVTKLDLPGSALVYSTYLGGSGNDAGFGIAVDPHGNAYVTGRTGSSNYPIANAVQSTFGSGFFDAFVTKLDSSGSGLVYSTYLGGSGNDAGFGIAVDPPGNAYVTGQTSSQNFPTTAGVFQPIFGGVDDAFVTKLDSR